MPAEWTCERVRRFGVISVLFGVVGALQLVPLVGSLAAMTIGILAIREAADLGCQPRAARVGVGLGTAGLAIFVVASIVYITR